MAGNAMEYLLKFAVDIPREGDEELDRPKQKRLEMDFRGTAIAVGWLAMLTAFCYRLLSPEYFYNVHGPASEDGMFGGMNSNSTTSNANSTASNATAPNVSSSNATAANGITNASTTFAALKASLNSSTFEALFNSSAVAYGASEASTGGEELVGALGNMIDIDTYSAQLAEPLVSQKTTKIILLPSLCVGVLLVVWRLERLKQAFRAATRTLDQAARSVGAGIVVDAAKAGGDMIVDTAALAAHATKEVALLTKKVVLLPATALGLTEPGRRESETSSRGTTHLSRRESEHLPLRARHGSDGGKDAHTPSCWSSWCCCCSTCWSCMRCCCLTCCPCFCGTTATAQLVNEVCISFSALVLALTCASVILHEYEFAHAKAEASAFWLGKGEMLNDFRTASALSNRESMEDDVLGGLALLNQMGTCKEPPKEAADMDWQLHTAMYYSMVLVSTIGYGDLNVETPHGMRFAIAFSVCGMGHFNWFRGMMCLP
jgi:hypothetical protein